VGKGEESSVRSRNSLSDPAYFSFLARSIIFFTQSAWVCDACIQEI